MSCDNDGDGVRELTVGNELLIYRNKTEERKDDCRPTFYILWWTSIVGEVEWKEKGGEDLTVMKSRCECGIPDGVYVRIICITREYRGGVARFIFSYFFRPLWGSVISSAAGINIKSKAD